MLRCGVSPRANSSVNSSAVTSDRKRTAAQAIGAATPFLQASHCSTAAHLRDDGRRITRKADTTMAPPWLCPRQGLWPVTPSHLLRSRNRHCLGAMWPVRLDTMFRTRAMQGVSQSLCLGGVVLALPVRGPTSRSGTPSASVKSRASLQTLSTGGGTPGTRSRRRRHDCGTRSFPCPPAPVRNPCEAGR